MADKKSLKSLAVEISKVIASRDNVTKHDRNNSMDMTILKTLHQIGHPEHGLPGVRPHILKMVNDGEITVFSSRGGLQPVQLSDVSESNFERWCTSNADADKVRRKFNIKPQDGPEEDDGAYANVELFEVKSLSHDAPVFHLKARCEVIPPELLALPADACIRYVKNIGGIRGEGRIRAGEYLQELTSIIKRQAEGFFTINEAAQILAESSGGDAETRKAKLWRAIRKGDLDVLDTDDREPVLDLNHVRDFIHLLRATNIAAAGFIFPTKPQTAPMVADGPERPRSNKSEKTLFFEAKVLELLDKFWNDRTIGTRPNKSELCAKVYAELLRTNIRGERGLTESMVRDAAKPWKQPLVMPAFVPDSKFNDKRHPFKDKK